MRLPRAKEWQQSERGAWRFCFHCAVAAAVAVARMTKASNAPRAVGVLMVAKPTQAAGDGGFGERRSAFLGNDLSAQPRVTSCEGQFITIGAADTAFDGLHVGQVGRVVVQAQFAGVLRRCEQKL